MRFGDILRACFMAMAVVRRVMAEILVVISQACAALLLRHLSHVADTQTTHIQTIYSGS